MKKKTKKKESLLHVFERYLFYFLICAMIGWLYEVFFEMVIWQQPFSNRGVLFGPWLPVYGFGAVLIISIFGRFVTGKSLKTKILLIPVMFVGVFLLTSFVELITSYLCEWFMGSWPWDYTMFKYTLDDRVALVTSTVFGVGGLFFLYILKPLVDKLVSKFNEKALNITSAIILIILIIDCIYSFIIK